MENKTTSFGPIGRGAAPYILNFQNILLEKKDKENKCNTILHCIVNPEQFTVPKDSKINVFKAEENELYVSFSSEEPKLNFTCSIDQNTYIQTYRVNGEVLFQCRHDPNSMELHHTNMNETISNWTFVDH